MFNIRWILALGLSLVLGSNALAQATKVVSSLELKSIKLEIVSVEQLKGSKMRVRVANRSGSDFVLRGDLPNDPFYVQQVWDEKNQKWVKLRESASMMKMGSHLIQSNETISIVVKNFPKTKLTGPYRLGLHVGYTPGQPQLSPVPQQNRQLTSGWAFADFDPTLLNLKKATPVDATIPVPPPVNIPEANTESPVPAPSSNVPTTNAEPATPPSVP